MHSIKNALGGHKHTTTGTTGANAGTTGGTLNRGSSSSSSSSDDDRRTAGQDGNLQKVEAPVVRERVHHKTEHVDQTQEEEIHHKTGVRTVVQPVMDQRREASDLRVEDQGTKVTEEGSRQSAAEKAEMEMRRRQQELEGTASRTADESHYETNERGEKVYRNKERVIEQVQPVVERDIEAPHRVEHRRKDVKIVHDPTEFHGTEVAPAVTVDDFMATRGQGQQAEGTPFSKNTAQDISRQQQTGF